MTRSEFTTRQLQLYRIEARVMRGFTKAKDRKARIASYRVLAAAAAELTAMSQAHWQTYSIQPATGDDNWQIMEINGQAAQNQTRIADLLNTLSASTDFRVSPDNDYRIALVEATSPPPPLTVKYNRYDPAVGWGEQIVEVPWQLV